MPAIDPAAADAFAARRFEMLRAFMRAGRDLVSNLARGLKIKKKRKGKSKGKSKSTGGGSAVGLRKEQNRMLKHAAGARRWLMPKKKATAVAPQPPDRGPPRPSRPHRRSHP